MSNLTSALTIVLAVNVMLWLGQAAMLDINPDGSTYVSCEGSLIGGFESNNCTGTEYSLDETSTLSSLPNVEGQSVPTEENNWFSDMLKSIKNWIFQAPGVSYVTGILSAPFNLLKAMKLPSIFAFAIGAMWYGITLFLIIGFIFGRDT